MLAYVLYLLFEAPYVNLMKVLLMPLINGGKGSKSRSLATAAAAENGEKGKGNNGSLEVNNNNNGNGNGSQTALTHFSPIGQSKV